MGYCVLGKYEGVWECLTHESTRKDARETLNTYDMNEPNIVHAIRSESMCPDNNSLGD